MISSILPHAHALLLAASWHVAAPAAGSPPVPGPAAVGVPNPAPTPIPGLDTPGTPLYTLIGWGKWLAFFMGVIGLIICGVQMMIGRRNRHQWAADGAAGIPWVLGGLTVVLLSAGIAGVFIQP